MLCKMSMSSLRTFMMICLLGTIMVTPRKSAFKFSGSSCAQSREVSNAELGGKSQLCKSRHAACLSAGVAWVHGDEEAHARVQRDGGAIRENELALALPDGAQHTIHLQAST